MVSIFRKYQKASMVLFAIISCFALIGFFNGPTSCSRSRVPTESNVIGKIYGTPVTKTVFSREARKAEVAGALHMDELVNALVGRANSREEALENFAWNSLVLNHEADRLQLEPMNEAVHSDESVADEIKKLFQTEDGQFDPVKYNSFVQEYLPSLGFGPGDLEEVVAEDLRMQKVKDLLHTTFVIPEADFRADYTMKHQKLDVSVIRFNIADFESKVQVPDDEIKKTFEQNLEGYKSDEKRAIKFAAFALSDAEQKLTGKDRIAALQKLANSVEAFMQALQEKGAAFDDVAAKLKVPVTTIPPFAPSAPDPKIPQVPGFLETVFQLTPQNPDSEPIRDEESGAYYVAHLDQVVPSRLLTLPEARPQIVEQLKHSRAQEALNVQASATRNKILADLSAGKSFEDAAKAEGRAVVKLASFSLADPSDELEKLPDGREILYSAFEMKEGQLGEVVPTEAGGDLVYMQKREPIDPKQYETDRAQLEPEFDNQRVDVVFNEWLRKQRDAANILIGENNAQPPPVPPPPK